MCSQVAWVLVPEALIAEVLSPKFLETRILSPEAGIIQVLSPCKLWLCKFYAVSENF